MCALFSLENLQAGAVKGVKDSNCTFGAGVRKTAGARSCSIPELLTLKGIMSYFHSP